MFELLIYYNIHNTYIGLVFHLRDRNKKPTNIYNRYFIFSYRLCIRPRPIPTPRLSLRNQDLQNFDSLGLALIIIHH